MVPFPLLGRKRRTQINHSTNSRKRASDLLLNPRSCKERKRSSTLKTFRGYGLTCTIDLLVNHQYSYP